MKTNYEEIFELRTKTTDYFGAGAIQKAYDIAKILKNEGIERVTVITGKSSYRKTGAWDVIEDSFKRNNIKYNLYDKVTPNPTDAQVDEAAMKVKENDSQAVYGIGGGSPIDAAKSAAILGIYKDKTARELYEFDFVPEKALPIIAVNTTHGTGTEVNRFAVVSVTEKDYKPAIAYDCIYPRFAIDDPALMTGLSAKQTMYVTIDAVNHVVEAATSKAATPYSIMLAKETIRIIGKYLPIVNEYPANIEARYWLTYASALAGISFDNGLLHFTHALEHPMSAVKPDLSHGLGLAAILPAVINTIYDSSKEVLTDIFSPVIELCDGADEFSASVENWLFQMGVTEKLNDIGFNEEDVSKMMLLAKETPSLDLLLSLAPVKAENEVIENIYRKSLKRMPAA